LITTDGVVNPVTRAHINLQFSNSLCEIAENPGIAMDESINAHEHARSADLILEAINPRLVGIRLGDPHSTTVARELRIDNGCHHSRGFG
jgi:hypothetical protein